MEARTVTVDASTLGQTIAQAVQQGGSFVLTVTGNSMRPTLTPGTDQVCLCAPGNLSPGDIIFFRRVTGEYILHRILKNRAGVLTVNGDSQTWTEEVRSDRVVAVVSRIRRRGKWYEADCAAMRVYSLLWRKTRPLRPALIRLRRAIRS